MKLRNIAAMCLVFMTPLAGCNDPQEREAPLPPASVTGVIVDIESEGIGEVSAFTVKDGDKSYEVFIDPAVDYDFPLAHLNEHKTTSDPVVVRLSMKEGKLYAQSIEDV